MKILIVEDSLQLICIYTRIIEASLASIGKSAKIIGIVDCKEYEYYKDMEFDLTIFDWNILGGTSRPIVECINTKEAVFITGYAANMEVHELSLKYSFPIIQKPASDEEIQEIIERVVRVLYADEPVSAQG
jgi:DNA-binding NtrC family response regulator